jgi:hypothetical protein
MEPGEVYPVDSHGNRDRYAVDVATAARAFPEAVVLFDTQCADLFEGVDEIRFRLYRKKGAYANGDRRVTRDRLCVVIGARQLVWHVHALAWVRHTEAWPWQLGPRRKAKGGL